MGAIDVLQLHKKSMYIWGTSKTLEYIKQNITKKNKCQQPKQKVKKQTNCKLGINNCIRISYGNFLEGCFASRKQAVLFSSSKSN